MLAGPRCSGLATQQICSRSPLYWRRVLLWRRSDNICFALLLGSGEGVTVGEAVECQVQGILQVRALHCFRRSVAWRMQLAACASPGEDHHWSLTAQ